VEVLDIDAVQREREQRQAGGGAEDLPRKRESDAEACGGSAANTLPEREPEPVQTKEERRGEGAADTRRSVAAGYRGYEGGEQWRVLPSRLPSRGGGASAVAVGDLVFVFLHGKGVCSYDPTADRYSELTPLPVEDWHCFDVTAVSAPSSDPGSPPRQAEEVYVIGGASKGAWAKVAYLFHTRLRSWRQLPAMPQAKRRMAAAVVLDTSSAELNKESSCEK
jgi:hypothetical protein